MSRDLFVVRETGGSPRFVFPTQSLAELTLSCEFWDRLDGAIVTLDGHWAAELMSPQDVIALLVGEFLEPVVLARLDRVA